MADHALSTKLPIDVSGWAIIGLLWTEDGV